MYVIHIIRTHIFQADDGHGEHFLHDGPGNAIQLSVISLSKPMLMPFDFLFPDFIERLKNSMNRRLHRLMMKEPGHEIGEHFVTDTIGRHNIGSAQIDDSVDHHLEAV